MNDKTKWLRACCLCGALVLGMGVFASPQARAAVVINEIDADQTSFDTQEFIELYSLTGGVESLNGLIVVLFNGSSDTSYMTIDLTGFSTNSNGFFTIGSLTMGTDIELDPGSFGWLQNGADAVALYSDLAANFPNGTAVTLTNLVDAIVYDTNDLDDAGLLTGLGETVQYNEDEFGTKDTTSIARQPDGTGGFVTNQTPTPGVANGLAPPTVFGKITPLMTGASGVPVDLCATGGVGALTFNVLTLPANGTLSDGAGALAAPRDVSGQLRYTPNPGYSGLDSFTFSATDTQPVASNTATHELGVQQSLNSVVISEVMHSPSGDQRIYEYVEIYNLGASPVKLTRLDTDPDTFKDTTDNLTSNGTPVIINANSFKIIATDVSTLGFGPDIFQCEWNVFETDIIRVPINNFETMFAAPHTADCNLSDGSRLLLYGTNGILLDALDIGSIGAVSDTCVGDSYAYDNLLDPLNAANNDLVVNWFCASQLTPGGGLRTGASGDTGNPAFVPGEFTGYTYDASCFGACCLTDGTCLAGQTPDECLAQICGTNFGGLPARFFEGAQCTPDPGCPAALPLGNCCLPIGVCLTVDECSCQNLGGNFDDTGTCGEPQVPTCSPTVSLFINELDYDVPGTDTVTATEFIELKGTPGTSLAGWTLEFFNGNGANGGDLYATVDLATVPGGVNPGDGFLVVGSSLTPELDLVKTFAFQNGGTGANGSGDGVVLLFNGVVVEALSYDTGSTGFTAFDGQAAGTFLTDIGVVDSSTTTLQKLPDGGTWTATFNNTPGVTNFDAGLFGACCDGLTCSFTDQNTCTSSGFVYLGDGTNCNNDPCIPRGACCQPDGSCVADITSNSCDILGGTWNGENSLCADIADFVRCLSGPSGGLAGTSGFEANCNIWDLDADTLDVDLRDFALLQDDVCVPDPVGACCPPDGVCQEISQFECATLGGDYRGDGVVCAGLTPPCDPPIPGNILINEIWADDPGGDDHEFIELYNSNGVPADLAGFSLIIVDGDTGGDPAAANYRVVNLRIDFTAAHTFANGYFTMGFGPNLIVGTNVDADLDTNGFGNSNNLADEIQNGSQTYALVPTTLIAYCTSNGVPDASCTGSANQLTQQSVDDITTSAVDTVATRVGLFDHVYFFAPLVQDEGQFAFDYAQRIPNGTDTDSSNDWETVFGNEQGDAADPSTPDAVNVSQSTIAGACCDGTNCLILTEAACIATNGFFTGHGTTCVPTDPCNCTSIADAPVMTFPNTQSVCITGAIISSTLDLVTSTAAKEFYIQDPTGTNGLTVYGLNEDIDPLLAVADEGDAIEIRGTLQAFFDAQEIIAPFSIQVLSSPGIPAPFPRTVDSINDLFTPNVNDDIISTLIVVRNIEFVNSNGTFLLASGGANMETIRDADNPAITFSNVRCSGLCELVGQTIPDGPHDLVGIVTTFSQNYNLKPRTMADIIPRGACCHAGPSCTDGTEAECVAAGGTYQGDFTLCSVVGGSCP